MKIEQFAETTNRVIARDGFDGHLPTACFPARKHISVLEAVPSGGGIEQISINWAKGKAQDGEEFLVAFRVSDTEYKIVRQHKGEITHATFSVINT